MLINNASKPLIGALMMLGLLASACGTADDWEGGNLLSKAESSKELPIPGYARYEFSFKGKLHDRSHNNQEATCSGSFYLKDEMDSYWGYRNILDFEYTLELGEGTDESFLPVTLTSKLQESGGGQLSDGYGAKDNAYILLESKSDGQFEESIQNSVVQGITDNWTSFQLHIYCDKSTTERSSVDPGLHRCKLGSASPGFFIQERNHRIYSDYHLTSDDPDRLVNFERITEEQRFMEDEAQ